MGIATIGWISLGFGILALILYLVLFAFAAIRLAGFGSAQTCALLGLAVPIAIHLLQPLVSMVGARFFASEQFSILVVASSILWNLLTFVSYGLMVLAVIRARTSTAPNP